MKRKDVFAMLKEAGLPVAYRKWAPAKPPPLPYIVYYFVDGSDLAADDGNYVGVCRWCAELYSAAKDDESEERIKQVLKGHRKPYAYQEVGHIEDGPFEAVFYFTTIGG